MNLNYDPDKHLLEQIDHLLETKQPTGNAMLDELAATRPVSRSTFQNALEERLLAQLQMTTQGETPMATSTNAYMPMSAPRRNWLPLTLLAAMIAIAVAGLMLINGRGKSPTPNEMALAAANLTPTATVYSTVAVVPPSNPSVRIPGIGSVSPVVVAVRDIPRGTVLSSRWLAIIYSSDDTSGMYSDREAVRGLIAQHDIPRWQPILPGDVSDQLVPTSLPTAVPAKTVKIVIALQNLKKGYTFPSGDLSNIAGYSDWPADAVPDGALRFDNENANITSLWGKTLQVNVARWEPIQSSFVAGGATQNIAVPTSSAVHNHNLALIPLSALTEDSLLPGVGGSVDVVALLPFKTDTNLGDLPSTPMPDGSHIVETLVLRDTLVLYHGDRSQPDATVAISASSNDMRILGWLAEQPQVMFRLQKPLNNVFDVPDNMTVISIPTENITATENIQPGDRVNVISTCAFVPDVMGTNNTVVTSKTDCTQAVEDIRAINVQVFMGEMVVEGRQPVVSYDSIAFFMPREMTTLFTKLNDAKMHFKLVPATKDAQPTLTPTYTATPVPVPSGKVAVDIPLASVTSTIQKEKLQVGDYVDVIATVLSARIDSRAPAELQQMITPQPLQPDGMLTQRVVQAAPILNSGDVLTLAVSPDEAKVIQWLLSAKLPIMLRPITPAVTVDNNTAPFTLQLPLDSASRWATDDLQVGDTVDVVMSFVSGSGDALSLDFKPYSTLSWVDAASKGEVSYPIYAPTVVKTGAQVMPGAPGANAIFIHRILQNAEVTAINTYIDPKSGRMSTLNIIIEMGAPMTSDQVETIKAYIQAGMPYLLVKH